MKTEKFGKYLAFQEVFGDQVAIQVTLDGDMDLPPFVIAEQKKEVARSNYT